MTIPILDTASVADHIAAHPHLDALVDRSTLTVREVGDGNLNLVFIATDAQGASIVLKQSLPYVRMVGESWPLSQDRILAEARAYEAATRLSPDTVPGYHGIDEPRRVVALEDLSAGQVWRAALDAGRIVDGAAEAIGRHVARVGFGTSSWALPTAEYLAAVAASPNAELEQITLDLVLTDPFREHPDNAWLPALDDAVLALREPAVLDAVSRLRHRFRTSAESLVHGDLHAGSVFVPGVDAAEGAPPARVFDLEFAFYGPIAFDLGVLIGNTLLAQARAAVLGRPAEFQAHLAGLAGDAWRAFEAELRRLWPTRVDAALTDGFLGAWLRETWADVVGYAAAEATRRIVGLAKASDIETLPEPQRIAAARWVLETARALLDGSSAPADADALAAFVGGTLPGSVRA